MSMDEHRDEYNDQNEHLNEHRDGTGRSTAGGGGVEYRDEHWQWTEVVDIVTRWNHDSLQVEAVGILCLLCLLTTHTVPSQRIQMAGGGGR